MTEKIWAEALLGAFKKNKDDQVIDRLVKVMTKKGRRGQLRKVLEYLKAKEERVDGVERGQLTLAQAVDQRTLNYIVGRLNLVLGVKKINYQLAFDESLVAGGQLATRNKLVDFSFRGLIEKLHGRS